MIEEALGKRAPLLDAIKAIEISKRRLSVVVDDEGVVVGTLTDGDIRRHILAGGGLSGECSQAMNLDPLTVLEGSPENYIIDLMRTRNIVAVPLVDANGRYKRVLHLLDFESGSVDSFSKVDFDFAVIMAGGEGRRLRPITEKIPKPMLEIGGVPLLERQILRLSDAGISKVYISVNHLGEIIHSYFGSGEKYNVQIEYLWEDEPLGTAGALRLLPEKPANPILVMNGDVLTTSDFLGFYQYHIYHQADLTMAAIDYQVNVPYGVVETDGPRLTGLREKPSDRFLCNAGIYAISPSALDSVCKEGRFDMTDLVGACLKAEKTVCVFPVHEYWNDIGTPEDLDAARQHFQKSELGL